ncbi:hypothetical protein GC174_17295 [bacterium]|nr:hypothetical protein [bacterium]
MQVSKLILGVNIAATLSVALTGQAKAAEEQSATAEFLKASMGSVSSQPKALVATQAKFKSARAVKPDPAAISKYSSPKSVATRNELAKSKVKMMQFVPGRKLPSRQELALKEQQAKFAEVEATRSYSASISTTEESCASSPFYLSAEMENSLTSPRARRATKRQARRTASKVIDKAVKAVTQITAVVSPQAVPHREPVLPGQVGHPCSTIHSMDLTNARPLVSQGRPQGHHIDTANGAISEAEIAAKLEAPHLSQEERAQLDRLARVLFLRNNLNQGTGSGAGPGSYHSPLDSEISARQRVDQAYSKNGPPPFPLNLVPEPAMKDFLSQARNRKSMISSYPGAFGARQGGPSGGAGFQSYAKQLKTGGFGSYSKQANAFSHGYASAHKTAHHHTNITRGGGHNHGHSVSHSAIGHNVPVSHVQPVIHQAQARVATYAPYSSY